ncbi:acyl carrier protein [Shivajiella indica]|uniref:Acyl carrier protein n=1 Tax=Shivajiella indica TaxID=872115 RepID=A0ABW5B6U9_9BACT
MSNLERYNTIFQDTFNVGIDSLNDDFNSETISDWDSVTQLTLVTAIEDEFDIMLDSEDILDFKSYVVGKQILAKYEVEL